jgi:hypothetical protein
MSITPQKTLIRVYKGNSKTASSTFRYDSISLAKKGYVPISEVWAQGTWGCFAFLIALALCFIFIGFLVFIYRSCHIFIYRSIPKNIQISCSCFGSGDLEFYSSLGPWLWGSFGFLAGPRVMTTPLRLQT